ncbi:unnamed protein product [Rotaria magnacalcarata]|nr:unnamed protein product [Rotaria magnacalcarata]
MHPIKQKRLRDEHRLTKTLIAVVVVFLVCNTFTIISYPDFVRRITRHRYPNYMHTGFRIQKLVTNIMLLLNYSINFFFYCAFNEKFLDTFKATFYRRIRSYLQEKFNYQNDSTTTQQTLSNSTTSSVNSARNLQPKLHSSCKHYSNYDEDFQRLKQHSNSKYCSFQKPENSKIDV